METFNLTLSFVDLHSKYYITVYKFHSKHIKMKTKNYINYH